MAMVCDDFLGDMAVDRGRGIVEPGSATEACDTIYRIPLPTGHKTSGQAQVMGYPGTVFRVPAVGGENIKTAPGVDGQKRSTHHRRLHCRRANKSVSAGGGRVAIFDSNGGSAPRRRRNTTTFFPVSAPPRVP